VSHCVSIPNRLACAEPPCCLTGAARSIKTPGCIGVVRNPDFRLPPAYLGNDETLKNAQLMATHDSLRTRKPYDCTGDEITLDEVERIVI